MSLAILFHFLCAQHVSDINISIIRSLWLFCWITTLVVLFLVRCVLEFRCGWVGMVSLLQAEAWLGCSGIRVAGRSTTCASACNMDTTTNQPHRNSNTHQTKNNMTNVVIRQNNRKLLMMDILMSETCWAHKKWNKIASDINLVFYSSTIKNPILTFFIVVSTRCQAKHVQNDSIPWPSVVAALSISTFWFPLTHTRKPFVSHKYFK